MVSPTRLRVLDTAPMRPPLHLLIACLLVAVPVACHASEPTKSAAERPMQNPEVVVVTADGRRFPVRVELAQTEPERARGLMHRTTLGADDGMLFLFPDETVLRFWMRNTLIPLDMIFIAADGTIVGIVENARPRSDEPRGVDTPSRYVVEVNGGWARRNAVTVGDRVELQAALAKVAR